MNKIGTIIGLISFHFLSHAEMLTLQNNESYKGCTDTYIESCPIVSGGSNSSYDGTSINHGDEKTFAVGAMRYNAGWSTCYYSIRGIVKFDLNGFEQLNNAMVHKAELSLYAVNHHVSNYPKGDVDKKNGGKSASLAPYEWDEHILTWLNYGEGYDDKKTGNIAPRGNLLDTTNDKTLEMPIDCWETFDVTEGVKNIVSNDVDNNGFMLSTLESYKILNSNGSKTIKQHRMGVDYASSECENIKLRPKLTISYTPIKTGTISAYKNDNLFSSIIRDGVLEISLPNNAVSTYSVYSISGKLLLQTTSSGTSKCSLRLKGVVAKGVYVLIVDNNVTSFKKCFSY